MHSWWSSIPRRFRRLISLSREERALFRRSWFLLPIALIQLRFRSVLQTQERLERMTARADEVRGLEPQRVAELVAAAARAHLIPIRCLPRSLVLQQLLRRGGHDAELCFGVAREGTDLLAHAWVEVGGVPLAEPAALDERFSSLEAVEKDHPPA